MADPTQAFRATLEASPDGEESLSLVLSLTEGQFMVRQVLQAEAVEWAEKNVPP